MRSHQIIWVQFCGLSTRLVYGSWNSKPKGAKYGAKWTISWPLLGNFYSFFFFFVAPKMYRLYARALLLGL